MLPRLILTHDGTHYLGSMLTATTVLLYVSTGPQYMLVRTFTLIRVVEFNHLGSSRAILRGARLPLTRVKIRHTASLRRSRRAPFENTRQHPFLKMSAMIRRGGS
jgi:hypothetical protein